MSLTKGQILSPRGRFAALVLGFALAVVSAQAQLSTNMQEWMRRLDSSEFRGEGFGGGGRRGRGGAGGRWVDGGTAYTTVERGEIVRYDAATGERKVLMTAKDLTPAGEERAVSATEAGASADGSRLLFTANPEPTMIRKTAYDYWVLNKADHSWNKLGGKKDSRVLYAKLSPDGSRAAYVRDNNIYVETIDTGAVTRLTSTGSSNLINGILGLGERGGV